MRRHAWLVCLGVVTISLVGLQGQEPGQRPPAPDETPTFRVGTRLATIDAVVVDDKGRHVTDLRPEDFEVIEHGKRQTVRQAVYVQVIGPDGRPVVQPLPSPATTASARTAPTDRPRPLAGAGGLTSAARASRVIAIVVDDLGLSFESTADVRRMLTNYVDTNLGPADLVAIIRTAGGVGTLQQFTTDRRLLHAAIARVQWSLQSRSGVAAFKAVEPAPSGALSNAAGVGAAPGGPPADDVFTGPASKIVPDVDGFRDQLATTGTLGALEYVLRGIEPLAGRKSVVFVSEGFDLGIRDAQASRMWSAFTRVMDRANRAGVVVYAVDPRGLQTTGMTAEDDPQTAKIAMPGQSAPTGPQMSKVITKASRDRLQGLYDSQDSLLYLAEQTGGFAVLNTNDLAAGLARIVDDTRGYYLLGFDTSLSSTARWDPNDVSIRIKPPGLTVRARRGLFGPAEKDRPRDEAPADPLVAAALSPFAAGAIDVRLTTLFAHDTTVGSFVRTLFFVDPAGLTFVDGANGTKEADLSVLLMAIGDNGQAAGQVRLKVPLRLDENAYRRLRQQGMLYSARLAIGAPGGYQIRAAVQDDRSSAIGTSAQFVDVPKVGKDHVALSGVVMMDLAAAGAGTLGDAPTATARHTDVIADGVLGEPAIKIFRPGSDVAYTFEIYDGRGTRKDGFSTRATLLRDGKAFYTTPPSPVGGATKNAEPVGAVPVGGTLSLGRALPRGTYTLQVSVAPQSGKGRDRQASQWVDFEVR
jgi:VWFA-related protein